MIRFALAFLIFFIGCASSALAGGRADRLKKCQTLTDCLTILDAAVPEKSWAPLEGDEREIAAILKRFGEPAKLELIRRAESEHQGWRGLASAILQHWHMWSPSDVPALRASLQHGGWVAWPLGEIATPDAIRALVDHLAEIPDPDAQTGWVLKHLGARALPYLFPMLEDERQAWKAASVIRGMARETVTTEQDWSSATAQEWLSLATRSDQPKSARLAALRGLAIVGDRVRRGPTGEREPLRALLKDADADIRDQALKTLIGIHDIAATASVRVEKCAPSATEFDAFPIFSILCVWRAAAADDNGRAAGPYLMKFLESRNAAEVASAIGALGYVGYDDATQAVERSLGSRDWRIVRAAVQSLGWLGAVQAIPDLDRVASSYWLPEVRYQAQAILAALKSAEQKMARPSSFAKARLALGMDPFKKRREYACPSERWEWQSVRFPRPEPRHRWQHSLPLGGGMLTGTNYGEFGGQLNWEEGGERKLLLVRDNVVAIEPAEGGAIVLFGVAHMDYNYGYAIHVSQRADGGWSLTEVARLPGVPEAFTAIGPDLLAVWSDGRVIVFTSKEILGLAACAA